MKPYPTYKDSGIEWVGKIPEHWIKKKLKFLGKFSSSGIDKKIKKDEPKVKIVNFTDIYKSEKKILDSEIEFMVVSAPEQKIQKNLLEKGDLIFLPSSETKEDLGLSALVNENLENTSFSYHVIRLNFDYNINHAFKKYLTNNNFILNKFSSFGQGTTRQIIGRDIFNNMEVILPPLNEQTQIANYLDKKTAQIDSLIDKKENLIQLLEEEKTALINQAVTKGLDPNVKMKDSGVEWLGEIPEHWEVSQIKYVTKKIGSGVTPRGGAETYLEEGIPLLRSQNVYFDRFKLDSVAYISESIHNHMKNSQVQKGDVLLNITGGSIGRCFYVSNQFREANVNQHVCIVRPNNNITTKFLHLMLSSEIGQNQIEICQTGGNREALNFEQLRRFYLVLPDIESQEKIIQFIGEHQNRIFKTISNSQKEIELLKEYKTTLISEVVTGKVDVRDKVIE